MSTYKYLKESSSEVPMIEVYNTMIHLEDPFIGDVSLEKIKSMISLRIPSSLFSYITSIRIGDFKHLEKRNAKAIFHNGVIYLTNKQASEKTVLEDIVHEIGHAIELKHKKFIINNLSSEYLKKRKKVLGKMNSRGIDIPDKYYAATTYDVEFDLFLSKKIGLAYIDNYCKNIMISGYSLTSLSEYFCEGLENYMFGDLFYLQSICPMLYNTIEYILQARN